jgi:hypothetical protein
MKIKLWKKIVGCTCFLFLMFGKSVWAEEIQNPLSSVLQEGVFYIDAFRSSPVNLEELNKVIAEQYKDFLKDNETTKNQNIKVESIQQDFGKREEVTLIYSSCSVNGGCGSESVTVPVDFKVSDRYKEIVSNGVFEVDAVKPKNEVELDAFVNASFMKKYNTDYFYGSLDLCYEDYSNCVLNLYWYTEDKPEATYQEQHIVKVLWKSLDSNVKKMVDTYMKKMEDLRDPNKDEYGNIKNLDFQVSDLNLMNYFNYLASASSQSWNSAIRYAEGINELFDYSNLTFALDIRAGDARPLQEYGFGYFTISYQGVVYGLVENVGVWQNAILYIPDEIENTSDAYIAAAKKRLDAYFGNNNVKIEVDGKIDGYVVKDAGIGEDGEPVDMEVDFSSLGDVSKMGDYVYKVTIGNISKSFVMIRDSSKITDKPILETKDIDTNITISTASSEVPLDTVIQVQEIKKEMETFGTIQNILKFKEDSVQIYDLKLYSEMVKDFIKTLSNGTFEVSIPIKENLKGKTLFAYYVRDNGKVEEYPVTVHNGIATFLTSHFSIYTLSEKLDVDLAEDFMNEDVPKTHDKVLSYALLGGFGVMGLLATFNLKKKFN